MFSKKHLAFGGVVASVILIAFGVGSIAIAISGRSQVQTDIAREQVVGTPDMTPALIKTEAASYGLKNIPIPSCAVANVPIKTGSQAECFAEYMRIHTLDATHGQEYSQMPEYLTATGTGTNNVKDAAMVKGAPVSNPARNIWVTETALTTALDTSYFAEQVSLFSIMVGIALLLSGIGFLVLSLSVMLPLAREEDERAATA
jgi:hypothetical protein